MSNTINPANIYLLKQTTIERKERQQEKREKEFLIIRTPRIYSLNFRTHHTIYLGLVIMLYIISLIIAFKDHLIIFSLIFIFFDKLI